MSEISEAQAARDLTAKNGFKKFYSRNAFLLSLIEDRAKHLKKASDVYKRRQLVFELVSVSATGLITILAGINLDGWLHIPSMRS
jgi:hypothetical protein